MKVTITKKFLVVPVCYEAQQVTVQFKSGDKLVFDMDMCLNPDHTDAVYYVNFERFKGMTFDVEGVPEGISFDQADEADETGIYEEPARPKAHFSAKKGWINDPNGCIRIGDTYHLYFQHNPVHRMWGNMHWGHATSKDLIHWQEHDIVLFPDNMGTMYSGSAILDQDNVSGLGTKENPPILYFYTASGNVNLMSRLEGRDYTQCLAYSLDGGMTLIKYEHNPILEHQEASNRDPKVIYSEEMGRYVMALYLNHNDYGLYASDNLIDWTQTDRVVLPEDSECPDFYPLPVEGRDEVLWVLTGASDRYLVGRLSAEGKFTPVQDFGRLHYGNANYAAQTFSNITDGRRLKIGWNNFNIPCQYFNCAMNIPSELKLIYDGSRYVLCAQPVRELETLHTGTDSYSDQAIAQGASVSFHTKGQAQDIRLNIQGGTKAEIEYEGATILIDNHGCYVNIGDHYFPSYISEDGVTLRIISDTMGFEIYAGCGQAFACVGFMTDPAKSDLVIKAVEGDTKVRSLEISPLANIWKK